MKVDTSLSNDGDLTASAKAAQDAGYDGLWVGETRHDPFMLVPAGQRATTRRHRRHVDRHRLRPHADDAGEHRLRPGPLQQGRFVLGLGSQVKAHIERRFSMPWSHPAPRMRELDPGDAGDLGDLAGRGAAGLSGRVLHAHPDDAVLLARAARVRPAAGLPRRRRRAHDGGRRRGRRRVLLPPLHDARATSGGHASGAARGREQGRARPSTASRSAARPSSPSGAPKRKWRPPSRAPRSRSPSTPRLPPIAGCSIGTAGATCSPS